jgi:glycosyltransferase involved in cell wall biosynthesis
MRPGTSFSVIIPTYNEVADIGDTLDAVLAQGLPAHEIIVVDGGSTDGTLDRLRTRAHRDRIIVIDEGRRRGVAAARNTGIDAASGEVVVLLNADVMPEPDYLERLAAAYAAGADFVSVNSRVLNTGAASARYLQAEHELLYPADKVGWTEGFSCRRDLARAARFPEEIPGLGGEDVAFFDRLLATGHRWVVDYSIVVRHRTPATLRGFWQQWRWRGNAVPYIETRLQGRSRLVVTVRRAAALCKSILKAAIVVPNALAALRRTRRSPRGLRDLLAFWLLSHVQQAAHRFGEMQTLALLWRDPAPVELPPRAPLPLQMRRAPQRRSYAEAGTDDEDLREAA